SIIDRHSLHDRRDGDAVQLPPDAGGAHTEAPARSRQVHPGAGDGLGILLVLAVPDHLGGQSSGRHSVLLAAHGPWLGRGGHPAGARPFRPAVCAAVVARFEAQFQAAAQYRAIHPVCAVYRSVLAVQALPFRGTARELDGYHGPDRPDRIVAGVLLYATAEAPADTGERPQPGGDIGTWTSTLGILGSGTRPPTSTSGPSASSASRWSRLR